MAKKITRELTDDLDGSKAERTTTFSLDNRAWEIDLSEDNRERLEYLLGEFMAAGRRIVRRRLHGPSDAISVQVGPGNTASDAERRKKLKAVREWARANGYTLSDRGRIPGNVLVEYEAAHNGA